MPQYRDQESPAFNTHEEPARAANLLGGGARRVGLPPRRRGVSPPKGSQASRLRGRNAAADFAAAGASAGPAGMILAGRSQRWPGSGGLDV